MRPKPNRRYALYATLAVTLLVRLPGIGWGLPPATESVRASGFRSSYAFDEDDILSGVSQARVARLDFDPHDYHWGTMHLELVLLALDGAEAVGVFHMPWRQAYFGLDARDFVREYVVARLVAVVLALFTVWALFGVPEGRFAAMLVAVSPAHLLQSDQVRADVAMATMLALMLWFAARPGRYFSMGFAGGLAIAAKYSAVSAVAAIVIAVLAADRLPWRGALRALAGVPLGFVAGGPYVAIKPHAFYEQIKRYMDANARVPVEFQIPAGKVLALHLANLIRFSIGPVAFLLGCAGLVWMLRRRSRFDCAILAGAAAYAAILVPLRWPMVRYDLPLAIFFGLAAGVALAHFPERIRILLTVAALIMPAAACLAQIRYMRAPHPADVMMARVVEAIPPHTPISRLFPESPPFDEKVYPLGPDVFVSDLAKDPPQWVLLSDLPDLPFRTSNRDLLQREYDVVARTGTSPKMAWATLGERGAPHDWKYTHPNFTLYRKKSR
jgi:hypothetical protein